MRIVVGVMTHNVVCGLREDLLESTLRSLEAAFPSGHVVLFDNRSTDGTDALVRAHMGIAITTGNGTPGAGRNRMLPHLCALEPDLIVLSDDDMLWHEGAEARLRAFFGDPERPAALALVSGLLEPVYPWNTPRARHVAGGVAVLIRDSCPGCAWAIPLAHLRHPDRIDAVGAEALFKDDFGYDHDYCLRLAAQGELVGQLDLAVHIGWEASSHGNRANRDVRARPLDREKWGI